MSTMGGGGSEDSVRAAVDADDQQQAMSISDKQPDYMQNSRLRVYILIYVPDIDREPEWVCVGVAGVGAQDVTTAHRLSAT